MIPQHLVLSERELAILQMVSQGCTDGEIGSTLHLHGGTIKNHIHKLLVKWGLRNRTQLAIAAYQYGLTDPYNINLWLEEDF